MAVRVGCSWCEDFADVTDYEVASEWEDAHVDETGHAREAVIAEFYPNIVFPWNRKEV